jgi:site-specific recombinase XerD
MRVECLITSEGKERYMVVDDEGEPVEVALRYIKYKDNTGSARNTLRSYCYHLKLFFQFLEQEQLNYRDIGLDEMAAFMRWLQTPYRNLRVTPIIPVTSTRSAQTINLVISTVIGLYDYLMRHDDYSIQLSTKLKKQILGAHRGFKDFLYHINRTKSYDSKILKLKVPTQKPKIISKENISSLLNSCSNIRDKFLIQLLWESSMRIGEALALWLEDFVIDARKIQIKDRGELENNAEIKTVCSPRSIDVSSDLMNLYMDYIAEYHSDEVDTNHVFIKLSGENKYHPMEYQDVVSLFKRLKNKTGIDATPHVLRHTSLTELRKAGWKDEYLMKRAGHAHIQTTMQIYIHPSDEDIRKDWEQVECQMNIKKQEK